jgi:hypothetical protein
MHFEPIRALEIGTWSNGKAGVLTFSGIALMSFETMSTLVWKCDALSVR